MNLPTTGLRLSTWRIPAGLGALALALGFAWGCSDATQKGLLEVRPEFYALLDATTTWNVTPVSKTFPGDRACPAGATLLQDVFGNVTGGDPKTESLSTTIDGKEVTVTITTYADNSFKFEIANGVTPQMFVKGGQDSGYLLYQYDPPVTGATNSGPVSSDTGLHDGYVSGSVYQDVSHLDFCLYANADPLTAEKTAVGSYERVVTWKLTKSVNPASWSGNFGESLGTSTWTVEATKTEEEKNFKVTGTITVYNTNGFAVPFTVSDKLDDGTMAAVDCDPNTEGDQASGTAPANGSATCSYTAPPLGRTASLNTAEVTSGNPRVKGTEATASVSFTEKLIGDNEVTLDDDREKVQFPKLISASATFNYDEPFTCSSSLADYDAQGVDKDEYPNKATLKGTNTDLSASAKVTTICTIDFDDLTVEKDAAGSYDRTVTWTLKKSVAPATHSGFAGAVAGTSTWTVVADKTEVMDNYKVTGTITITNPNPIPVEFSVTDQLGDGTVAAVDCDPITEGNQAFGTAPAKGSATCSYTASPSNTTATLNTATVTSKTAFVDGGTAQAGFSFNENLIGYGSGTLSDDRFGYSEAISDDMTKTFQEEFTCSADQSLYASGGHYSFTVMNTAKLNDNIDLTASAEVKVDCYAPVITKDADASYDERHEWDVDKTVDPLSQVGSPGDVLPWTWKVVVSETIVEENFQVTGKISVSNPAGSPGSMTVSLVDKLDDGTGATVDCGDGATSVSVAAGATGTCSYTAYPKGRTATKNTATGTFNAIDFVATSPVDFAKNVIKGTANVTDTEIGLKEALTAGSGPWTYSGNDSHTCSSNRADYFVNGVYTQIKKEIINWAYVHSGGEEQDKDDATTTYACDPSFVDIYKTTNGAPADPTKDISFALYSGTTQLSTVSTLNNGADLEFPTALKPGATYTICEYPVPAGYTFVISVNGGNVLTYAGPPGESAPTGEIQCFDFVAASEGEGATVTYNVENRYPGGAPRTPGYWKNWSTCSGGNQQYTAEKLGGTEENVFLLDDLLPQTLGSLAVNDCEKGVSILDARDVDSGNNMANDAAYTLARALLAARLNQDAGACVVPSFDPALAYNGYSFSNFEAVLTAADGVLSQVKFDGSGDFLGPRNRKDRATAAYALWLYEIIDDYNNSGLCTGDPSH